MYEQYAHALVVSDLTSQNIVKLRDDVVAGRIRTIVVRDLQKIYERKSETAANLEGNLRALVDEGFRAAAWESQRAIGAEARALVVAAMPVAFYRYRYDEWDRSGFARRFLWCHYRLDYPELLTEAIESWNRIEIGGLAWSVPAGDEIEHSISREEAAEMRSWLRFQPDDKTGLVLLQKIGSAIRWRRRKQHKKDNTMEVLNDFSSCLGQSGAILRLKQDSKKGEKR